MLTDYERFRSLFEHNLDPVMFVNVYGIVDRVNAMFEDVTRTRGEDIVNKSWVTILIPEAREEALEIFSRVLGGEAQVFETTLQPADSSAPLPVRVKQIPLQVNDDVRGASVVLKSIAAERIAYDYMHDLAFHDPLTGLPNRALFGDRLVQCIVHAKRYNHPFGVMFLDLDGFKLINDRYGHAVGDDVLRAFGERLSRSLRESDTFARLGGDEFAVLQSMLVAPGDVEVLAKKLIDALQKPFLIGKDELRVGLSIGIAIYPWHGVDEKHLTQAADRALYRAKSAGKNSYYLAGPI
ncbi:MAG: diguanylate cyclase domain-containing protein [Vulcanimicrobiaceae bacterium]